MSSASLGELRIATGTNKARLRAASLYAASCRMDPVHCFAASPLRWSNGPIGSVNSPLTSAGSARRWLLVVLATYFALAGEAR